MKARSATPSERSVALHEDTRGAVYVEFILSFMPLFLMFLGMIQIAMLYAARLVVQQSAITATRAAAVVLDDDPSRYDDQQRLTIEGSGGGGSEEGGLSTIFGGASAGGALSLGSDSAGARYSTIRFAAMVPLMAITPAPEAIFPISRNGESLGTAIGTLAPESRVAGALMMTRFTTNITFPQTPRAEQLRTRWNRPNSEGDSGTVTARVTHLYMCPVPIANRLLCEDGVTLMLRSTAPAMLEAVTRAMQDGWLTLNELEALSDEEDRHEAHLDAWEEELDEMEAEPNGPGLRAAMLVTAATLLANGNPARFRPLQAEATLPVQAANYCYHNQSNRTGCWEQR